MSEFFNIQIQSKTLQEVDGRGWEDSHETALAVAFERYKDKLNGNSCITNICIQKGA
jgi:hypothetical protein